ncbi:MAG: DUF349 domain-containing protein [Tannerellaceae bacterium]|jgi:hypothetical protein|nr:DUF349 domain-containing protein [Tannerellaceae bacterium]
MMDTQETNQPEIDEVRLEEIKEPEATPESMMESSEETTGTADKPEEPEVITVTEEPLRTNDPDNVAPSVTSNQEPEATSEAEAPSAEEAVASEAEAASAEEAVASDEEAASAEEAVASDEEAASAEEAVASDEEAPSAEEAVASEEEAPSAEEAVASEEEAASEEEEPIPAIDSDNAEPADTDKLQTKEEVLEKLIALVNSQSANKAYIDALKQSFYRLQNLETEKLKEDFLSEGGKEEDFYVPENEAETKLKEILSVYREKKASLHAEEEQVKAANYALKLQLIERMKQLTESSDDFNKLFQEFKEIQQRWKEVRVVPQEHANSLWKNYQIYNERFYDLIKINHQLRDYDFRKNLETKLGICEAVEKLLDETNIVEAFYKLQKLHFQWRETGPVSKELREEVWQRFKAASTVIHKRHQTHFESVKEKERSSLERKTAICETIENIDFSALVSLRDWEAKQREVISMQAEWKTLGFAPRKVNAKLFERYRRAVDNFFTHRNEYSKELKGELEKNLELKTALCEKAEAMKDSTDWRASTEKFVALQREWKSIGGVPRKHGDQIWKRFISACDYFFDQKHQSASETKGNEVQNLAAKRTIIENIKAIDENLQPDEAMEILRGYMGEWNSIGFVPFREKEKLHIEYNQALDFHFERLKIDKSDRKLQMYRNTIGELSERGKGKLYGERDKLMRAYERLKTDLQTYENNIGFLSVSSKGGGGLVKDLKQKIEKLKDEMKLLIKKIEAIDENLE